MRLSDIPQGIKIYGNTAFRGECPKESLEQVTFFNKLRKAHPATWGILALHPRNEQQLKGGQHGAFVKQKAEGLTPGASDIIIPARVSFVCELKRKDHTKSKWENDQTEYLFAASNAGAFACVAFGHEGAWSAFEDWLSGQ